MKPLSRATGFPYWHEAILAALLAALMVWAWRVDPAFAGVGAQIELSTHVWELALLALPMTFIIITSGIDLSVGSAMGLCAVVIGLVYENGGSPFFGAGLALAVGAAAGALNGWFVARVRVHPLIVTLATLAAFRGVAVGISKGRPVSGLPEAFCFLGGGTLGGAPLPAIVFAIFALAAAVVLTKTPFGRRLYAIGHNETAARFSGIAVDRIKLLLYTLSGAFAGLAAVFYVARRNTAKADVGSNMELEVITAVVLGGVSIYGGRGNMAGVLLGALLIHETREFISWHWQRDELNFIVIGALLILSALLHKALSPKGREDA